MEFATCPPSVGSVPPSGANPSNVVFGLLRCSRESRDQMPISEEDRGGADPRFRVRGTAPGALIFGHLQSTKNKFALGECECER